MSADEVGGGDEERAERCLRQRDEVIQRARTRAIGFLCQSGSEQVWELCDVKGESEA